MSFKFLEQRRIDREIEYLSHVSPDVRDRAKSGLKIGLAEYKEMRMNSYERDLLVPHLTNEALIWVTDLCMSQSRDYDELSCFSVPTTYNDAINRRLIHELIRRLKLASPFLDE